MIISKLQGGLGNQLFQWAFGRALSLSLHDKEFYLDDAFYEHQHGPTIRTFELNKFQNLKYETICFDLMNKFVKFDNINDVFDANNTLSLLEWKKYNQQTWNYYLNGYWQSEKYFKHYENIIKEELKPSDEEICKLNKIIEPDSVSIHVRRTDYVTSNGYHPVQDISYFSNGIDIIGDYNRLYVFSDEIEWCKTNFKFQRMEFVEGYSNIEDLRMMSFCKHNIIVNSSFSWWAAWLNNHPDKKIIAPSKWFGDQVGLNESDIISESWIKI